MTARVLSALCAAFLAWAPVALAQLLISDTSCADFVRLTQQKPDDPSVGPQNHELIGMMMRYVPKGVTGPAIDRISQTLSAGPMIVLQASPRQGGI